MINQIMFIEFKAMKLFWRKCFVTKWASHLESLLFFTNHHSMNCHLCTKLRWPKTCIRTEAACHGWQRFGELCGMGYSDLEQSNSTSHWMPGLENCVVCGSLILNSRIRLPGLENCVVWASLIWNSRIRLPWTVKGVVVLLWFSQLKLFGVDDENVNSFPLHIHSHMQNKQNMHTNSCKPLQTKSGYACLKIERKVAQS